MLPAGHTGSSLFHAVLDEAAAQFPGALESARFPKQAGAFKQRYGLALARFEAARVSSPQRVEIARYIVRRTRSLLRFGNEQQSVSLHDYLSERGPTPRLEETVLSGARGVSLEVPFEGRVYRGLEIRGLVDRLHEQHQLTSGAQRALHWLVDHAAERGGKLDLAGERFVVLGAGAELASSALLLAAGAHVLWVDLADPTRTLQASGPLAGSITRAAGADDLLAEPRKIAAAIRAFAADGPVHIGMFAYAPGASKEWRLGVTMNAIVGSLEPALVGSVSLLISPTTPSALSAETQAASATRYAERPRFHRWLERTGLIAHPGVLRQGETAVSLSTVSLQGLSYQAAQYISKVAAAETYAVFGSDSSSERASPITVSANVAGVTRTRSLSHPLFNAAFEGAARFGVRVFDPATTRALNGYLMLHDLLNPEAPGAATTHAHDPRQKASAVLSQQIHGGIYSLPFALENVIRAAAVVGMVSRPSVLLKKRAPAEPAGLPAAGFAE